MGQIAISVQVDGVSKWTTTDLEGMKALGVMASTLVDMYDYFFDKPDRPKIEAGAARVCIEFDGDALYITYRPEDDTIVAQGLVAAALVGLHRAVGESDFHPLRVMLGAIRIDNESREKEEGQC